MTEQAMRLALEALECMHTEKCDYMRRNNLGDPLREDAARLAIPAITALRQALEQQPADEPVGYMDKTKFKMLAEGNSVTTTLTSHRPFQDDIPLYTRPQPAAWVGLTDEEIKECFKITPDQFLPWQIYQRIETKLKDKNVPKA